ncbi:hypothetical protein [Streptomyces sp. R44]|uniref:Gram-positive cocci surface proteins LPxTG domain-containing protein n=1 Tax=Streptomyces sp. R44 TaxID=3238633 RepID=A0AB39T2H0_9ACTN
MRTALRTALAAALVAGVAATPVLAAGNAFAAGTTPAPTVTASAKATEPAKAAAPAEATPVRTVELAGGLSAKVYAKGDQHPYFTATVLKGGTVLGELKAGAGYPQQDTKVFAGHAVTLTAEGKVTAVAVDANGTLVRTVELAGGLSAKVYAKGDQHPYFTATVLKGGTVLGELKAGAGYPQEDTKVFAGYSVTLTSEGEVTATAAGTQQGTLVRTETLINGTIAKIYKVKDLHHRAELFHQGNPVGVLDAITRPVAGNDNGEFFVLFEDGRTLNWERNYVPGAEPGMYVLADGTVLELAKKDGRYGLQLIENGHGRGFTYLTGSRQVWTYGKAVVVLEQDGGFAAYIPGSTKQAAPELVQKGSKPAPGPVVTVGECTVRQDIPSVFALLTVTLTNDLEKGPKAVLKDEAGKPIVTVDRAHPADLGQGLTIKGANTATPQLGQRTQGGDTPYRWTAFPKLPKGCEKDAAGTPAGNNGTTTDTGQTSVIPQGGVAAGAELGTQGDSTALIAAGAGAASLAAAGLGFVVLRRRAGSRA